MQYQIDDRKTKEHLESTVHHKLKWKKKSSFPYLGKATVTAEKGTLDDHEHYHSSRNAPKNCKISTQKRKDEFLTKP